VWEGNAEENSWIWARRRTRRKKELNGKGNEMLEGKMVKV
jgi:hypothetical protein